MTWRAGPWQKRGRSVASPYEVSWLQNRKRITEKSLGRSEDDATLLFPSPRPRRPASATWPLQGKGRATQATRQPVCHRGSPSPCPGWRVTVESTRRIITRWSLASGMFCMWQLAVLSYNPSPRGVIEVTQARSVMRIQRPQPIASSCADSHSPVASLLPRRFDVPAQSAVGWIKVPFAVPQRGCALLSNTSCLQGAPPSCIVSCFTAMRLTSQPSPASCNAGTQQDRLRC
jgi:hypothetical protein